jgi:hypothetical protein
MTGWQPPFEDPIPLPRGRRLVTLEVTDGKAGTVDSVLLDDLRGLRISIRSHYGKWPVSTIKFAQKSPRRFNNRI